MTQSMCWGWIHLSWTVYTKHLWHDQCVEVEFTWTELFTLNTCDTINVLRLNSLAQTIYTKHLWYDQSLAWTIYTKQLWHELSWIHLAQTVYTKHLWHWSMCWGWIHLARTVYTKHLWHDQCVEVEFTCKNCLH